MLLATIVSTRLHRREQSPLAGQRVSMSTTCILHLARIATNLNNTRMLQRLSKAPPEQLRKALILMGSLHSQRMLSTRLLQLRTQLPVNT